MSELNLARDICQFHAAVEYGTGFHFCMMGQWEEGLALVKKVMTLTPSYPSWYNIVPFLHSYQKKNYKEALKYALKIDAHKSFQGSIARCASYAQLGEKDKALKELNALLDQSGYLNFMDRGQVILTRYLGSKELAKAIWQGVAKAKEK